MRIQWVAWRASGAAEHGRQIASCRDEMGEIAANGATSAEKCRYGEGIVRPTRETRWQARRSRDAAVARIDACIESLKELDEEEPSHRDPHQMG